MNSGNTSSTCNVSSFIHRHASYAFILLGQVCLWRQAWATCFCRNLLSHHGVAVILLQIPVWSYGRISHVALRSSGKSVAVISKRWHRSAHTNWGAWRRTCLACIYSGCSCGCTWYIAQLRGTWAAGWWSVRKSLPGTVHVSSMRSVLCAMVEARMCRLFLRLVCSFTFLFAWQLHSCFCPCLFAPFYLYVYVWESVCVSACPSAFLYVCVCVYVHQVVCVQKCTCMSTVMPRAYPIRQAAVDFSLRMQTMKWIELRQATPQGAGSATLQRLELALLYVFQNFRKAYIGEQANVSSTNLYARLAERVGIRDHVTVMDVIMNKTMNNLKVGFYLVCIPCPVCIPTAFASSKKRNHTGFAATWAGSTFAAGCVDIFHCGSGLCVYVRACVRFDLLAYMHFVFMRSYVSRWLMSDDTCTSSCVPSFLCLYVLLKNHAVKQ